MADGNNLVGALKTILEFVNKSDTSNDDIDAIEAENKKLRQEKFELLSKMNQLVRVKSSQVALITSLTSQLETQKRIHTEFKEVSSMRMKELSQRSSEQINFCKERLKQAEDAMILPYDKVVEKIEQMEVKMKENVQKSKNLSEECKQQSQKLGNLKKFSETLKKVERDQTKQLNRIKKNSTRT